MTPFLLLSEAPKEFHTVLSTMRAYQCAYCVHCRAYSLPMLIFSWNNIFYLLINALHHHCVIDDVIDQNYCFFAVSQNKLHFLKENCFHQLLNDIMKIILQFCKILWIIVYLSNKNLQIIINTILLKMSSCMWRHHQRWIYQRCLWNSKSPNWN